MRGVRLWRQTGWFLWADERLVLERYCLRIYPPALSRKSNGSVKALQQPSVHHVFYERLPPSLLLRIFTRTPRSSSTFYYNRPHARNIPLHRYLSSNNYSEHRRALTGRRGGDSLIAPAEVHRHLKRSVLTKLEDDKTNLPDASFSTLKTAGRTGAIATALPNTASTLTATTLNEKRADDAIVICGEVASVWFSKFGLCFE